MYNLQEKPLVHKKEHPALQNMKFLNVFLFWWVIFALLDSDPDPQHWFRLNVLNDLYTEGGS
jgi:hypothetical protein